MSWWSCCQLDHTCQVSKDLTISGNNNRPRKFHIYSDLAVILDGENDPEEVDENEEDGQTNKAYCLGPLLLQQKGGKNSKIHKH